MDYRVEEAKHVRDYVLWIRFSDGLSGEIDLSDELYGEIFEPLKNKSFFAQVEVHPELGTICWSNGADFSPEFLHDSLKEAA